MEVSIVDLPRCHTAGAKARVIGQESEDRGFKLSVPSIGEDIDF